ncbi:unnamed protein product [Prorocentrum cordatum]|uniref:Uncharacterized protein n=1 Tax=Prorocentrum cordatum TaxID=2364126 RepID=A0ABN9R9S2_9DINO|nr:unnamed protein product [Polarella glacialis]
MEGAKRFTPRMSTRETGGTDRKRRGRGAGNERRGQGDEGGWAAELPESRQSAVGRAVRWGLETKLRAPYSALCSACFSGPSGRIAAESDRRSAADQHKYNTKARARQGDIKKTRLSLQRTLATSLYEVAPGTMPKAWCGAARPPPVPWSMLELAVVDAV